MDACRYPTIRRATLANDIDCLRHCTVEMSLAQNISYVCIYVYIYFIVDNCVGGAQPRPDAIGPSRRGPAVIKSCTDYRIKAFVKNTVNIHRINLCKIRIQIRSTRAERFARRIDRCEVSDYDVSFQRLRIDESRFTLETSRNDDGDYFNSERSDRRRYAVAGKVQRRTFNPLVTNFLSEMFRRLFRFLLTVYVLSFVKRTNSIERFSILAFVTSIRGFEDTVDGRKFIRNEIITK